MTEQEIIIDAVLIKDPFRFKVFKVHTTEKNYQLHRFKLEKEKKKIIGFLKQFEKEGLIKSVYIPKNSRIQKELNELVMLKRTIDKSLNKIKQFFYK